jgi:hypothetical protein
MNSPIVGSGEPEISRREKKRMLLLAWALAMLFAYLYGIVHSPLSLPLAVVWIPLFPAGILGLLIPENIVSSFRQGMLCLLLAWICYVSLTLLVWRVRQRLKYLAFYGLLCLMLLINAIGCNVILIEGPFRL